MLDYLFTVYIHHKNFKNWMELLKEKKFPVIQCFSCGELKMLSWSSTNTPYLSHGREEDFCPYDDDMEISSLARNMLLSYLTKNGAMIVNTTCKCCQCTSQRQFSFNMKYECDGNNDILCQLGNTVTRISIETMPFSKVDNSCIKIEAKDILSLLAREAYPVPIKFTNHNMIERCASSFCITLREIASQLGYFCYGKWRLHCSNWNSCLWRILIVREQCLKCETSWKTSNGRPYCIRCYRELARERENLLKRAQKFLLKPKLILH